MSSPSPPPNKDLLKRLIVPTLNARKWAEKVMADWGEIQQHTLATTGADNLYSNTYTVKRTVNIPLLTVGDLKAELEKVEGLKRLRVTSHADMVGENGGYYGEVNAEFLASIDPNVTIEDLKKAAEWKVMEVNTMQLPRGLGNTVTATSSRGTYTIEF